MTRNALRKVVSALGSPVVRGALAVGVMSVLSACTASPALDYNVAIDPSFTSDQIDAITAGLQDWKAHVPPLQLSTSIAACSPAPHHVCIRPDHDPPDPMHDVIGNTSPGTAGDATVDLYVDRIQATGWDVAALLRQTAAHEMGHAMGLRHTGAGQLMAPDVPQQAHSVTSLDVEQFWAVRGG